MRISDWSSDVCSSDLEQIEFADVILISKIDLIGRHEREELIAILERLNAQAHIIPMVMGQVPLEKILDRSEEHTYELQSLMRISYAVICLKTNNTNHSYINTMTVDQFNHTLSTK